MKRWALALSWMALTVGCGAGRDAAWDTTHSSDEEVSADGLARRAALVQAGEAAWERRSDEEQLRTAIHFWQQALDMDPSDAVLWTRVSRAYYFLADGHLAFDATRSEEMLDTFDEGTKAGERALAIISPSFAQRMQEGMPIQQAVALLNSSAVSALYWRSSNLGKWASAKGFATLLSYKDEIKSVMNRCLELDADYFYAGPHRYLGVYYALAPASAGGDLARSERHFRQSLRVEDDYFATHVLFAESYAVKTRHRALFTEQLRLVINGHPNALPEARPENEVEQKKARALLAKERELFE